MSSPYDSIPAPRVWTAGGKRYHVGRLSMAAMAELQQVVKARVPDPRAELRGLVEGLPVELARHIWDQQVATLPPWPPAMDDPRAVAVILSPEGQAAVIYHALRKHAPGFTRDAAAAIAAEVDDAEFTALMDLIFPRPEPAPPGEDAAPKAPPPTPGGTTPTA